MLDGITAVHVAANAKQWCTMVRPVALRGVVTRQSYDEFEDASVLL